jgi:hypothetical protein
MTLHPPLLLIFLIVSPLNLLLLLLLLLLLHHHHPLLQFLRQRQSSEVTVTGLIVIGLIVLIGRMYVSYVCCVCCVSGVRCRRWQSSEVTATGLIVIGLNQILLLAVIPDVLPVSLCVCHHCTNLDLVRKRTALNALNLVNRSVEAFAVDRACELDWNGARIVNSDI